MMSKDELQGVRPDPDPNIDCEICGESFSWKGYWNDRVMLSSDPESAPLTCDECLKRADEMHDRLTNNRALDDFADPDA